MDFETAQRTLSTARNQENGKPLENNTRLFRRGDDFAIRLHSTDVVTIHRDGTYTLNSGGWQTVTTKARINAYSPACVGSVRGVWHLFDYSAIRGEPTALFHDGIRVDGDGRPLAKTDAASEVAYMKAAKQIDAMIAAYIRGFVAELAKGDFTAPSGGDCWGCYMVPQGANPGNAKDGAFGVSHILEHFREKYYVPSLLWRAMQRRGNPSVVWHMATTCSPDIAANDLRHYLRGVRVELIEELLAEDKAAA